MQAILNNPEASESLKDYIRRSVGQVAERNGGINKFFGQWDIRVAKRVKTFKRQYVELSGDLFNVANLLNKNKGVTKNLGNTALNTITGFTPATQSYTYNVNANTGVVVPGGNPYQFQLGLRYGF